jgi:hypothetical protein
MHHTVTENPCAVSSNHVRNKPKIKTQVIWDFRLCTQVFICTLKECNVLIFWVQQSKSSSYTGKHSHVIQMISSRGHTVYRQLLTQQLFLDCLTLKIKALCSFEKWILFTCGHSSTSQATWIFFMPLCESYISYILKYPKKLGTYFHSYFSINYF